MSSRVCNNCGIHVSESARFCAGCGKELRHEPTISSKEQNPPSVTKSAKKGFGIGTKIGLGVGAIFFLILIVGAIAASNTGSTQSSSSNISTSEQQAVDFIQHYKGSNGNGLSILQIVSYIVNIDYAGENIANNPSSSIGWIGLIHYDPNSSNVWEVDFDLKTYRENTSVKWLVNMDTHTIYPLNNAAKSILDLTNLPSNSVSNSTLSNVHLT